MKYPQVQPISWQKGPLHFLEALKNEKKPFCFYSGDYPRYSYIGVNPIAEWFFYADRLEKISCKGKETVHENPFTQLKKIIPTTLVKASPFFASGWVGFLNYEIAQFADAAFPKRSLNTNELLGWWGLYDPLFVFDHVNKKAFISSWGLNEEMKTDEKIALERLQFYKNKAEDLVHFINETQKSTPLFLHSQSESNFTQEKYISSIQKIIDYIHSGDCYQVNLSQRWRASLFEEIDPLSLFCQLAAKYSAPYSAYLDIGETQILSFSPEEFLTVRNREIITRPIKGTRRKLLNEENEKIIYELQNSAKDQSELLMIVDLERNDLGKVCESGSVKVPHLKQLESFGYVHHLIATIQGVLKEGIHTVDALRALFPGGSITGAPKKRAMEIIQELEQDQRGVYTGAIGFFDYSPIASFNIPIRTFEIANRTVRFGAGGGIVAESDPLAEYEETLAKSKIFFDLFL